MEKKDQRAQAAGAVKKKSTIGNERARTNRANPDANPIKKKPARRLPRVARGGGGGGRCGGIPYCMTAVLYFPVTGGVVKEGLMECADDTAGARAPGATKESDRQLANMNMVVEQKRRGNYPSKLQPVQSHSHATHRVRTVGSYTRC